MTLDEKVYADFLTEFNNIFYDFKRKNYTDLIFLCIGTDRVTGDSFGPLVGYRLKKLLTELQYQEHILVMGDLEETVCATNIEEKIKYIQEQYYMPYIVAIDAAFSSKENIGKIIINKKGIKIGKGINKKFKEIGQVSIKGIVAKDYKIPKVNYAVLQNIPLGRVMELSENTANGIYEVIKYS